MEKNISTKKTLKLVLVVVILIILFTIIVSTYSKYITQTENQATLKISNWHILLNDIEISENKDFSNSLNVIYDENENIAKDVIVPTSTGNFDVKLESTGTELPFEYEFSIKEAKPYSLVVNNSWGGGGYDPRCYNITIPITNTSDKDITSWEISFEVPSEIVAAQCSFWNVGSYAISGNTVTIKSNMNNGNIPIGEKVSPTMIIALKDDIDMQITNLTLNGNNLDKSSALVPDFKIISYSINNGELLDVDPNATSIIGTIIPPKDIDGNFTRRRSY